MKRIVLDNTISLNAIMSGAPATTQPTYTVAWADKSSGNPFVLGFDRGSLSGTTEKELVGSPASGTNRVIRSFSIVNIDTADVTIRLYTDDASTEIELPEITLNPGDELTEEGVFDSNGKKKIAFSASAAEIASSINNSSEKTTPVDGDKIPILDSAASFVLKWFSWANIKSALASATQTLTNKTLTSRSNEIHAEEVYAEVRNASGVVISKGDVVYASGYNVGADLVEVDLADADDGTKMPALGLAAEDIADNSTGKVAIVGILDDIDTSAYSVGDMLYVSTTPGELTGTAPTTDDSHVQHIGTVFRSNANTGAIEVQINPHPLKIVPALDSDAVSKKHADTKANLSGGNEFSGDQTFNGDDLVVDESTGNVGFGIAVPVRPIHIAGAGTFLRADRENDDYGAAWLLTRTAGGVVQSSWVFGPSALPNRTTTDDFSIVDYGTDIGGNGGDARLLVEKNTGNVGIGTIEPDAKLHVNGEVAQASLSADPADPANGDYVVWVSDGTGSGDDGDVMFKITDIGGTTKIGTLIDYSAV